MYVWCSNLSIRRKRDDFRDLESIIAADLTPVLVPMFNSAAAGSSYAAEACGA